MVKVTEKMQVFVEIVCFIIVIALCLAVYLHGKDLSCDKCVMTFKQERAFGSKLGNPIIIKVKVIDLFNNLTLRECLVSWDKSTGYLDRSKKLNVGEENVP